MVGAISRNLTVALAGASFLLALAACGANSAGGAQVNTDSATRAVYNNDYAGATQNFDDNIKSQVTRSQVGTISDAMHKLGDYQGLTFVASDPNKNEYTYRAGFTRGSMSVVVRLDPDGKFSAYRVLAPVR